jgi:hypothetical protein
MASDDTIRIGAVIQAQCARAMIRALGMQAENETDMFRVFCPSFKPTFNNADFIDIIDKEGIGENHIIEEVNGM